MTDTTATEGQHVDKYDNQNVPTTAIAEPVQSTDKTEGKSIMLMLLKFPCRPSMSYFGTILGRLKLTQLVLGVVCFVCATPESLAGTQFFLVIVAKSFLVSLAWCLIHLLNLREAGSKCSKCINWSLTELINSSIMTTLYFAASFVQLSSWVDETSAVKCIRALNLIAGTVGVCNTLVYATVCVLLFNKWSAARTAARTAARRRVCEAESVYHSVNE